MRIKYTNEILKSPEVVFPWIAEPNKAMQWQKNVKAAEILIDKSEVVGTTFKEEIQEDGNSLEMRGVITKYIKDQIIAFHLESKIHKVEVSYSLEGDKKSTRVTVDARINWKFPLNLLSLFIGRKMKTGIAEQLKTEIFELKRLCETS
jgi:hypothetical protein